MRPQWYGEQCGVCRTLAMPALCLALEGLSKTMAVIVETCEAFGLTVPEKKLNTAVLCAHGQGGM